MNDELFVLNENALSNHNNNKKHHKNHHLNQSILII